MIYPALFRTIFVETSTRPCLSIDTCRITAMTNDVVVAPRTDPVYNMHGYLTKVPVQAIIPFIDNFTAPGDTIVDPFAGSGMTAVAARMCGRNAIVSDISRLGQHIGEGYLCQVSSIELQQVAAEIVAASKKAVGHLYDTVRSSDQMPVEAIRAVWTFIYRCGQCGNTINYYEAFKAAEWRAADIKCLSCGAGFVKRGATVVGEEPVLTVVPGEQGKQIEQPFSEFDRERLAEAENLNYIEKIPSAVIDEHREMYRRSALAKWGLTETRKFFSQRNAAVLYDIWARIQALSSPALRKKMLFAFTAILPRASKRYQWSPKAPLNAANQTYYLSPVFFEWNVYDLFQRKCKAVIKADTYIQKASNRDCGTHQRYEVVSANALTHLGDESIDYVFTDPPFGSNIFYADMNLFQEAWLSAYTDEAKEAVIKTCGTKKDKYKAKQSYEEMLTEAFCEARRVLKDGGRMSVVFGNSKGEVWAIAQRAFVAAGFTEKPEYITILDKGQRSVKGLASGRENVTTLDLIVTFRKGVDTASKAQVSLESPAALIKDTVHQITNLEGSTASQIYLEVLRNAIYSSFNLADIDLQHVLDELASQGYEPEHKTGKLQRKSQNKTELV